MSVPVPAIVGVGQSRNRDRDVRIAPDPVELMRRATLAALDDAGLPTTALSELQALCVIDVLSWRYEGGTARALSERLGTSATSVVDSPVGGEQPIARIDAMAADIAAGRLDFGIIAGAEAQASLLDSRRAGEDLPWPPKPPKSGSTSQHIAATVHREAWKNGLTTPVTVYPLFENAARAADDRGLTDAQYRSSTLWERMSAVAATNPMAWSQRTTSAERIRTPSEDNRWIAFPYPKLMTANSSVNLGAAVILVSSTFACRWGLDPEKAVYPVAAAGAREIGDPLSRPTFAGSRAMRATLDSVRERSGAGTDDFGAVELYSCFPVVPDLASRHLSTRADDPLTVTGGLTFFGGPGNAYMLHAVASMVDVVRQNRSTGLLYGQGEFMTKHHALVIGPTVPSTYVDGTRRLPEQDEIDADRFRAIVGSPRGSVRIETFTVMFERSGQPTGVVVVQDNDGARAVAQVPASDVDGIETLMAEATPIGKSGSVDARGDRHVFRFA